MQGSFYLPRVYPLTDVETSGLSHGEQVRSLILGGASFIQLREKRATALELYEQATAALEIAEQAGAKVIINDRVDLALAIGAAGVHLGQDDMPPEAARKLLGNQAVIGYSTHNLEQARKALTLPIDYLAVGPIFETKSKTNTSPTLGLEGLAAIRSVIGDFPMVAIGGISQTNARDVINAGADSVAVISALLSDPDRIVYATQTLLQSLPALDKR